MVVDTARLTDEPAPTLACTVVSENHAVVSEHVFPIDTLDEASKEPNPAPTTVTLIDPVVATLCRTSTVLSKLNAWSMLVISTSYSVTVPAGPNPLDNLHWTPSIETQLGPLVL